MSRTYLQTASEIISRALRICGVLAEKQLLDEDQFDHGLIVLNGVINFLAEIDSLSWNRTWGTQTFTASSAVSNGGTYYRCIRSHTSSATSEPGVGADWRSWWYEDASVSGSAVAWATATAYTCAGDFLFTNAHTIVQAFLRYQNYDYPLRLTLFDQFLDSAYKYDEDIPVRFFFDKQNTYRVFLNPIPNSDVVSNGTLQILYLNFLPEAEFVGDPVPIPPGWVTPIAFLLAKDMAFEAGLSPERIAVIRSEADRLLAAVRRGVHKDATDEAGVRSCFSGNRIRGRRWGWRR